MVSKDLHDLVPAKLSDLISTFPFPPNHLLFIRSHPNIERSNPLYSPVFSSLFPFPPLFFSLAMITIYIFYLLTFFSFPSHWYVSSIRMRVFLCFIHYK